MIFGFDSKHEFGVVYVFCEFFDTRRGDGEVFAQPPEKKLQQPTLTTFVWRKGIETVSLAVKKTTQLHLACLFLLVQGHHSGQLNLGLITELFAIIQDLLQRKTKRSHRYSF